MAAIHSVDAFDLPCAPSQWPFAEQRRDEIAAHFSEFCSRKPEVWNGRVLLCRNPRVVGTRLLADYFETDFASFLAWRDWGFPDKEVFNCWGGGALRSADGAFVLGRMSERTANAGRIYFPAGTPDCDDLAGGRVDLAMSVAREVAEEVGLVPSDYSAGRRWTVVFTNQSIACYRDLNSPLPADALCARIGEFLLSQDQPELTALHLVRSLSDLDPAMPEFVTAFLRHTLSQ